MHGEYKVPGGKLVVVDVQVEGDRLAAPVVSGDFFLEPDEALEVITGSLVGQPADASVVVLAQAVTDALDAATARGQVAAPVTMVGFDARAVAMAVHRALGLSTTWDDHEFEVLHPGPLSPAMHVALDQVLTEELGEGLRGPTLRFWEWTEPATVIGSFQSLRNEVDVDAAQRLGVTVVRRISGGGAMFMEGGNCVTFSLVVPASLVDGMSFEESYGFLNAWVVDALADVGVTAFTTGINDIASPTGKLAGSAQKRLATGAVLHHVTMAYDIDADKMMQVLRIGREKVSDKGIRSANKRVDPVRSQTQLPRPEVVAMLKAHFEGRFRTRLSDLTPHELTRADALVTTKFSSPTWTARVP
ncbi:MAG: lipoate--protein ligase family protein [Micrococcales bacterium]|nr:lipoate--protein ligase family protein [Micrococcales bacterium]MCL2667877.1 lipoate--protein ligase family protein [Micrococcales bacterium]